MRTFLKIWIFILPIGCTWSQPGPDAYLHGLSHVDVDSGSSTSVVLFTAHWDSIRYSKLNFENHLYDTVFMKPEHARIDPWLPGLNTIFGVHYLNANKENVYVYVYCKHENGGIVDLFSSGVVALDEMNLNKGTYFVDWSSHQNLPFHQKIVENVDKYGERMATKLKSWKRKGRRYDRLNNKTAFFLFESLRNRRIILLEKNMNKIRDDYNKKLYADYYEVYHNWNRFVNRLQIYQESRYVFIINQKAVDEQQVSTEAVSPDELISYIKTSNCVNNEVAKKILSIFDE